MKALRNRVAGIGLFFAALAVILGPVNASAQEQHQTGHGQEAHGSDTSAVDHAATGQPAHADATHDAHAEGHACHFHGDVEETAFDATATAFHHISDANVYSIGPLQIPLPCILYAPGQGLEVFSSSKFSFDKIGHGDGRKAYNRYVLDAGAVKRVQDASFPMGEVELEGFLHQEEEVDGKKKFVAYACYGGKHYKLDAQSTADGGLFGGGMTSFYDFSITKNVVSMMLIFGLMVWMFLSIAKAYKRRDNMAPAGLQGFIEPVILFIQDEVAKPFLGPKWEKFLPFLLSLFFFILGLNLFGQIPILGGSNVTGNLAVTLVLALITFVVVNINGNKHYWGHVFWMPGVPAAIKVVILTPVEVLGLFIRPFTLMLRLFANITAGHIVILSFVGLIFFFGKMGTSMGGVVAGTVVAIPLTIFMMAIELMVAFIQAFVFTLLTASYIGAATEEHHHAEGHHH